MLLRLVVAAVDLFQEISVVLSLAMHIPIHGLARFVHWVRLNCREAAGHVLDEVTLFLGGGVDRGTGGGLGLGATAHGEVGTGKHGAENSHGEL